MSTYDELRAMPIARVLEMAGMRKMRDRWGPCPACGHEGGASERGRGPVLLARDGLTWWCSRCQTRAGGLQTARYAARASGWGETFRWAEEHGWASGGPRERERRPRRIEVRGRLPAVVDLPDGLEELTEARNAWLLGRARCRREFWASHRVLSPMVRDDRKFAAGWRDVHDVDEQTAIVCVRGRWTFWEVLCA